MLTGSSHHSPILAFGSGVPGLRGVSFGVGFRGSRRGGPFSRAIASRIMEWRRCSWEDMKEEEDRSPVQRLMSMQSRDWFRRVRNDERGFRIRGFEERESTNGEGVIVFRRR